MPVCRQAVLLYVATSGLLDDVPLSEVRSFSMDFVQELEAEQPRLMEEIQSTGNLSAPAVEAIRAAMEKAKGKVSATWQA